MGKERGKKKKKENVVGLYRAQIESQYATRTHCLIHSLSYKFFEIKKYIINYFKIIYR